MDTYRYDQTTRTSQALVTRDTRQALATRDTRTHTFEELIHRHLPMAHRLAGHYAGRGLATEDIKQVAAMGLVKAARRYDASRGNQFATFAVPTINGELRRHFRDHGWWVRPPRSIQELRPTVANAEAHLRQDMGHTPTDAEIAQYTDVDVEHVREVRQLASCFTPGSIDQRASDDAPTRAETLTDDDSSMEGVEDRLTLGALLRDLPPRDREIVRMRFVDELTQSEIGSSIGVTQMQVSRELTRILGVLREQLSEPSE
jgi:RNA polymerase sigma-B factor